MHVVEDIDGIISARARASAEDECFLTLLSSSGFGGPGGNFYPAESFTVSGIDAIAALHNLCERLMEAHAELNQREV